MHAAFVYAFPPVVLALLVAMGQGPSVSAAATPEVDLKDPHALPFVTVCFATAGNRIPFTRLALQAMLNQTYPFGRFEVLTVANQPTTENRKALSELVNEIGAGELQVFLHTNEDVGLGLTRNVGLAHARGEIIIYLDDDAFAGPNHVLEVVKAFKANPKAGVVGGKASSGDVSAIMIQGQLLS